MKDLHEFRITITPFCNYRCFFCHNEGQTEEYTPLSLTSGDYAFVMKIAKKYWGWNTVTITGGEPLISPIFKETVESISKEGVKITVVTNASLLSSPKKILKEVSQVNISLHSLDQEMYHKITGTSYPLVQVLNTIMTARSQLPELEIHLNNTVIRGMNDSPEEMDKIIRFAKQIRGEAKFVDLASNNPALIVPVEEIVEVLAKLGFEKIDEGTWQIILRRGNEKVLVTRCGFGQAHKNRDLRNIFLNPDGVVSTDAGEDVPVSVLHEIKSRDVEGLVSKVEWIFPPAIRIAQ